MNGILKYSSFGTLFLTKLLIMSVSIFGISISFSFRMSAIDVKYVFSLTCNMPFWVRAIYIEHIY